MPTTDTSVSQVIVNKLTKAQYDSATKSATEFYAVTDVDSGEAEVIGTTTGDLNYAIKFADGRLICIQRNTVTNATPTAWGSLYQATYTPTRDYAVQFIADPVIEISFEPASSSSNSGWAMITGGPSTTTPPQVFLVRSNNGTMNGLLCTIARGFWK